MIHRLPLSILTIACLGLLVLIFAFQIQRGETPLVPQGSSAPAPKVVEEPPVKRVAPPEPPSGEEFEVETKNPLTKEFVDEVGTLIRTELRDTSGNLLRQTERIDNQIHTIEKVYDASSRLIRERKLRNGELVEEKFFH